LLGGDDRVSAIAARLAKSGAIQQQLYDRLGIETFNAYRVEPRRLRVHKVPAGRDIYLYEDFD
jgi:hypothetical protein